SMFLRETEAYLPCGRLRAAVKGAPGKAATPAFQTGLKAICHVCCSASVKTLKYETPEALDELKKKPLSLAPLLPRLFVIDHQNHGGG
ncbi:MAG: hypothetical protein ABSC19_21435, partial [Syntrophorhabdales bacterium]